MSAWYERHFQEDYLTIYKQRDEQAQQELSTLLTYLPDVRGKRVLDLCCGYGRHSRFLAELGARVTGVDLSAALLKEALVRTVNVPVQYMRCDVRKVPMQREMDLVVNLFTSFGYFNTERENEAVFKSAFKALKPGGFFLFDYLNPGFVRNTLVPFSKIKDEDKEITQYRKIEDGSVHKTIIISNLRTGMEKRYEEKVKLYNMAALKKMVERSGLVILHTFGDYTACPFHEENTPRTIFICQKGDVDE
ncbi:class I SAM-dependent methyltransferase [Salipaludibacillus sp. CUR1]|uniref:class I SAM-dependent methyltransferase n=1 Tax=Salipaludibacillus sp. CUR1 TaxID=2820003 RepID=UPI001E3B862C|nr:class I SAM-dependent methyltransferase [Salipaludibacillus sp. CUR1]MCE7792192.1 class I SAM-dependent methyltransferase [Salipaludibacillus sp. CUR1]